MSDVSNSRVTKFTNGLILRNGTLLEADLWVDSQTGNILSPQSAFYGNGLTPDEVIDLNGKIVSPGLIDVQLNGAHGFDFSVIDPEYPRRLQETARNLIKGGVTSYLPTITSQRPHVYQSVLPHLGPSQSRNPRDGAESLGAHVEGPFLSPTKNGIHSPEILLEANSFSDIQSCYGAANLDNVAKITAAPELGNMMSLISDFTDRGIVYSIGHSDASYEEAQSAIAAGATMVTHMFNAMRPFGHRDPGIFGLLGQKPSLPSSPRASRPSSTSTSPRSSRRSTPRSSLSISSTPASPHLPNSKSNTCRPFFGLISDGIHLSAPSIKIAYMAHPDGAILVTDAMRLAGCPDGVYDWTNGESIIKKGPLLTLKANGRIAGSAVTLIDCVNNFRHFTGCTVAEALDCVTSHPAKMLGGDVEARKGRLDGGMDADLVVLDERATGELSVDQVWKFGSRVA